jgi:hypothetical protein
MGLRESKNKFSSFSGIWCEAGRSGDDDDDDDDGELSVNTETAKL